MRTSKGMSGVGFQTRVRDWRGRNDYARERRWSATLGGAWRVRREAREKVCPLGAWSGEEKSRARSVRRERRAMKARAADLLSRATSTSNTAVRLGAAAAAMSGRALSQMGVSSRTWDIHIVRDVTGRPIDPVSHEE
jgi:hypothetical protein